MANDVAAPPSVGFMSLLDRLWHFLTWSRLSVILLVWVAAVLALSAVVPQAPSQIEDPIVRSQWLASMPIQVRPAVQRLEVLGIFSLLDSVWLRLPLVLWLAHALVMLARLGPVLWRRLSGQTGEVEPLGKSFQLDRNLADAPEHVCEQFASRLEVAGFRVRTSDAQEFFIAWRWRWSWLGLAGFYLGLGLAALGLILVGWLGQVQEVSLQPDNSTPLPATGSPVLILEKAAATGADPLAPTSGLASLHLVSGVGQSRPLSLGLHRSRLVQGMWLTLTQMRPVVEVQAEEAQNGKPVLLQSFSPRVPEQERVRLLLSGDAETRFIGVPSQTVTLHVDLPAETQDTGPQGGETEPTFLVTFFRGADLAPAKTVSLTSGQQTTFDGVRYQVIFDYDAVMLINSTPWWMAVGAGWGLAALSFILLVLAPPMYVRADVKPGRNGSRMTLIADMWGDDQHGYRKLRSHLPGA
jgi:hypothetical protein